MKRPIRIRRAKENDPILQDLQMRILPKDTPLGPDGKTAWWIAWDGKKPVGFAAITPSRRFSNAGHLSRAGVLASHRGRGIQKKLIAVRLAYARRQHWDYAFSDTAPWNCPSMNSLIACGFRTYLPRRPYMADGYIYWRRQL